MNIARVARTLAPLKPVQLYGRVLFRLTRPVPDLSPAPARRGAGPWAQPVSKPRSLVGPEEFVFLNHAGSVRNASQWNDDGQSKLWLYNLHYFDCLGSEPGPDEKAWRPALIDRWISENPVGSGNGWEPYPISLRVVNWIKWAFSGERLEPHHLASLAVQVRWLRGRIERHLLGNHLLANAKALVFAGLFFEGAEAEGWLRTGLDILVRELPEQVLSDGGHFELSPMYHNLILEDVLDLLNLAASNGLADQIPWTGWRGMAEKMLRWAAAMRHPDGEVAFFNDAAFGIAPTYDELQAYAGRLGLAGSAITPAPLTHLEATGYVRLETGAAVALVDLAAVGAGYQPGHAHADTLSFELSVFGQRLIVNSGTSTYAPGPQREAERATAAHSTVEIEGGSSSEVWSSFRVGRRARVSDVSVRETGAALEVAGSHDGYRRLKGRPVHRRSWRMDDGGLRVEDTISGPARPAVARFHLAPGVSAEPDGEGSSGLLTLPSGQRVRWTSSRPLEVRSGFWRPAFGVSRPNFRLEGDASGGLQTHFEW
jgi:uncharacterized heparinase superfamily protein